jgi:hypothetical protein
MSFAPTTGILNPSDFETIHQVFKTIVAEPWFTKSEERRELFAAEIVDAYRQGIVHPRTLSEHCWSIAHDHYGNGGL